MRRRCKNTRWRVRSSRLRPRSKPSSRENMPCSGLPTLLLDLRPDNDLERAFVEALSAKAATVESVTP